MQVLVFMSEIKFDLTLKKKKKKKKHEIFCLFYAFIYINYVSIYSSTLTSDTIFYPFRVTEFELVQRG